MSNKAHPRSLSEARVIAQYLARHEPDERRLDADATNNVALALEYMRTKVYEADYPELRARQILTVDTDVPEGVDFFAYEETDFVGSFREIASNETGDDLPTVETGGAKIVNPVIEMAGSAIYTIADIRRAAFSGRDLTGRKLAALRRVAEQSLDQVAALGGSGGLLGLANRPVGAGAGQIQGTVATATSWDATPDMQGMVSDLNAAVAAMIGAGRETRTPDTLLLPTVSYLRLAQTYSTDGSPTSGLQRFLDSNGYVKRVLPWNVFSAVDGAGANASRGLLLNTEADTVSLIVPQEFRMYPAQPRNFKFVVPANFRIAGVAIYRPLGLRYLTGLPTA